MGIEMIVGITGIVLAVVAFFVIRLSTPAPETPQVSNWRADDGTLTPPANQTPATVGPLTSGETSPRDLRLSLLDLASRGFLHIDITPENSDDWVFQRTNKTLGAELHDHEWALLTEHFTDELGRPGFKTWAGLRDDRTRALKHAQDSLGDELDRRGWISRQATPHHSLWAWAGALVLLIGLVTTLYMLIDWLATHDFMGVIGGFGIMIAGLLLVSRGRQHRPLGPEGIIAQRDCELWKQRLAAADLFNVQLDQLGRVFGERLVWQLAFENTEDLVVDLASAISRAEKWGNPVTFSISWLTAGDLTPTQLVERLAAFVAGSRFESARIGARARRKPRR